MSSPIALVYGHSQSGGMGLDLVSALKTRGYSVVRSTHNGWSDAKLLAGIPELGDLSRFSRVYLYGGGNNPAPTPDTLLKMVDIFGGPCKVVVVLPPYNAAKESADVMTDPATKGWANSRALEAAGVPCFRAVFAGSDFTDGVHLRAGCAASKAFAAEIAAAGCNSGATGDVGGLVLLLAAVGAGVWYWRRRKKRLA